MSNCDPTISIGQRLFDLYRRQEHLRETRQYIRCQLPDCDAVTKLELQEQDDDAFISLIECHQEVKECEELLANEQRKH